MKLLTPSASVTPWLYWSIFPAHRVFLKLYFGQIVTQGLEDLPESGAVVLAPKHFSRWDPVVLASLSYEPLRFMTNPLYAQDYRQENDKQTALALTQALQVALLNGLETLESV